MKANEQLPNHYVLVLGCDISRDTFEGFRDPAKAKGILEANVYTASILETILYASHPDLLFSFFGVNIINPRVATVTKIKRRLAMKKKIREAFVGAAMDKEVIIRDIHRDIYPSLDLITPGISPWFKLEYFRFYHRGISLILGIVNVQVNHNEQWKLSEREDRILPGWIMISAYVIGNIPFDNVVDIDLAGDEFTNSPHLYCEFNSLGQSYEEIWYTPTEKSDNQVFSLGRDNRLEDNS